MATVLNQRNFFVTKRFEITDHSLKVGIKSPISYIEDEFTFEELTKKYVRKRSVRLLTLIPAAICVIGLIITICSHFLEKNGSSLEDILFYGVIALFLIVISLLTFENVINLTLINGRILSFYATSPSKNEVDSFLIKLLADQKSVLINRYVKIDPYSSTEQLAANLKWLRDRNIIDDLELDNLRIKILPKPGGNSSVGFKMTAE